jgi:hypothetical protein
MMPGTCRPLLSISEAQVPCTVKKTFLAARNSNSHLLLQLKANQAGLLRKSKATGAHAMRPAILKSLTPF